MADNKLPDLATYLRSLSPFPRIAIYLRNTDEFLCSLSVKNNDLEISYSENISDSEKRYLSSHFLEKSYEKVTYTMQTGGKKADGTLFDGIKEITISNNPEYYLTYLFIELSNEKIHTLRMRYIISLEHSGAAIVNSIKLPDETITNAFSKFKMPDTLVSVLNKNDKQVVLHQDTDAYLVMGNNHNYVLVISDFIGANDLDQAKADAQLVFSVKLEPIMSESKTYMFIDENKTFGNYLLYRVVS